MFRTKKNFLLFNLVSLLFTGLAFLTLYSYLQFKTRQPLYAYCPNISSTGLNEVSNTPKDDCSDVLHPDGRPSFASSDLVTAVVSVPENAKTTDESRYHIEVSVSKQWTESKESKIEGAQYDAVFCNDSPYNITDWYIQIALPSGSRLDSSWNGDYSYEHNVLTIRPLSYNSTIPAHSDLTFGFILFTTGNVCRIEGCTIVFNRDYRMWQNPVFWVIIAYLLFVIIADLVYVITNIKVKQYNKRRMADLQVIDQSLRTFANIIDAKDIYTKGHSLRVAIYSREIAKRMGMSEDTQQQLYYIALLHDIGKIGISDNILHKPGALTREERAVIEQHVLIGGSVLKDFTSIPGIAEGALYHHERYDGKGYCKGLAGDAIPLFARIICVADSFDAMSSARCYRSMMEIPAIIQELTENAGTQFDPDIIPYMLSMIEDGVAPVSVPG